MNANQDHIDLYLKGLLKGEQLEAFLELLKEDPELAAEVESQRQIIEGIKMVRHAQLKKYIAENTTEAIPMWRGGYRRNWIIGIAAGIALLAAFFLLFQNLVPEEINPVTVFKPKEKKQPVEANTDTTDFKKESAEQPQIPSVAPEALEIETIEEISGVDDRTDIVNLDINELETPEIEARRDALINSKSYAVIMRAAVTEEKKSELVEKVATTSKETTKQSPVSKSKDASETESPVSNNNAQIENIQIEIWESIVNYKGYNFNGNFLKIYGPTALDTLNILKFGGKYYLQWNKEYYLLVVNNNYQSFEKITDITLIQTLKN